MSRILLTGSNGLLGQNLISEILQRTDMQLLATSGSDNKFPVNGGYDFIRMDICNRQSVFKTIREFKPDIIIHAAAMTQVDACESNHKKCSEINIEGTRNVAQAAEQTGAWFQYISTDFIFNGRNGPYCETDDPDPVSYYGWSKLQGEKITRSLSVPWSIVRTILVYGVVPSMSRSNLVLWVIESLKKKTPIRVVDDQYRMPTLVNDLAGGILSIIDRKLQGIYHLSGPDIHSVLELAQITARFFNLDDSLISPVSSRTLNQIGSRPPSTGFVLEKAIAELDYQPHDFKAGLKMVRRQLLRHKNIN